jgi:hypothetical protein
MEPETEDEEEGHLPSLDTVPATPIPPQSDNEVIKLLASQNTALTAQIGKLTDEVTALRKTIEEMRKAGQKGKTQQAKETATPNPNNTRRETRTRAPPPVPNTSRPKPTRKQYSEIAAKNADKQQPAAKITPTPKQAKQTPAAPTPKRERRLVVQVDSPVKESTLIIRNVINEALGVAKAPRSLLVHSVAKNPKGNLILTLLEGGHAEDLMKVSQHVKKALNNMSIAAARIEPDHKWFKLIVHGISVPDYGQEFGMEALRDEINRFNPKLTLANLPRWLTKPESREGKEFSSAVIAVRTQDEQVVAAKGISVNGRMRRTAPFLSARPSDQCGVCQHFGHHWQRCQNQARCKFCAGPHRSREHHCNQCGSTGRDCSHTAARCCNCKEEHFSTSPKCKTVQHHRNNITKGKGTRTHMDESL